MAGVTAGTAAALDHFLKLAGERQDLDPTTARAYRSAIKVVLESLSVPDSVDLRGLDLESLLDRFEAINPRSLDRVTISTYRSRVRGGVRKYLAWLENDPQWMARGKASHRTGRLGRLGAASANTHSSPDDTPPLLMTYDYPLRPGLIVQMILPVDLTAGDAARIAAFVNSLAFTPDDDTSAVR